MASILTVFLSLLAILTTIVYFYVRHIYSYWKRRGVPFLTPSFPFGNFSKTFLLKKSVGEVTDEFYHSTSEPFIGVFGAFRPTLVVRDPELVRNIFIKHFEHFHDHGVYFDKKKDPLSAHLFALNGSEWKNLRAKLSPTFTSGKLKGMFSTFVTCGDSLQPYIDNIVQKNGTIEVRELSAQYATNVIASVAFGIDINCIDNPDTPFRKYGRKIFDMNWKNGLRFLLMFVFPAFLKFFKIRSVDQDVEDFMMSVVGQTLKYREESKVVRKDFFQLLVQLRNTGAVQLDDQWETVITGNEKKALTFNELAAEAYVFWIAGFETSATTMSFCLFEIAKNQEIQEKVHQEIDRVLAAHEGQITYDAVNEMKYLECCIDETLRIYPSLPILNRECTKEYTIPGTNVVIEEGTAIIIPAMALQNDPKYFYEPKRFIPERFQEESKSFLERPYMPFGEGPRLCIGMRMGKIQTKVGLILMLKNNKYRLSGQHIGKDLIMNPASLVPTPVTGLELIVNKR